MKIAISSTGKDLESDVDARFGRCNYFLILELENNKIKNFKSIENNARAQMGGAGITAGEIVAREKVNAVITVNLGPRAFSVFDQFQIKVYQGEGQIKKVVQEFLDKKLKELTDATGPQHRGLR
ncbi:dinitrogenase iron-molybdenum cofactor biosynthesis protein [Candidatus Pacearchaeota archaeon]|nr:dinitrogenase iron-molybdenum cofactor biosynthesis protein [Candidatus Pacearchaeota archaeon]MBD3282749.1 dinitrogenase iron-molybdenum cofactor biosynthesis protein [Candidatus Pacearchaeota archaeon]